MSWLSGILVYVILWWLAFFTMLPVGARSYHEAREESEAGTAESAPMHPRLPFKAACATGIAAVLWAIAWYLHDMVSFRA